MRFERLDLAPYGRFADRRVVFATDPALHVVFGRNEAGKTTTLEAIKDFLFGFPPRTPYAFEHSYDSMRVGAALRFADGERFEARRRKGRSNTLVDETNGPVSEERLLGALGGLTRETFETEFGLSQATLRAGGAALLATGGSLAETLAAGSSALSALVASRDRLDQEASALFTKRRADRRFYQAADAYDAADRQLREAVVTADALRLADQKRADALAAEDRLREEHEAVGDRLARLERASRTHPTLARLDALTRELAGFADLAEIDGVGLAAARVALDQDRALRAALAQLAAEADADAREIAARVVDRALIAEGEAIDNLHLKLGAVFEAEGDLPRRVESRRGAMEQLDDLARRLGLDGHAALLAAQPSDAELAAARAAIDARREATRRRDEARERRLQAERRREEVERNAPAADVASPEPLRRRLDALAERSADAERLRRDTAVQARKQRELAEAAARLDPFADPDALARAALPAVAEVAAFASADQKRAQAREVAARERQAAAQKLKEAEAALKAHEREAAGATRGDWRAARENRDEALDRLHAALDEPRRAREAFALARALVTAADAVGDRFVADVGRATRLEAAREEAAARRETLTRAEAETARLAADAQTAEAEWRTLWARTGIAPHAPTAMARWLDQVANLLDRRAEIGRERDEIDSLRARLEEAHVSLAGALAAMGLAAAPDFETGYREARQEVARRQMAYDAAAKAEQARAQADAAAREAERESARREAELAELEAGWRPALRALRLQEDALAPAAEAALAAWGAVAAPRTLMERETRSVEGIERLGALFAREVGELAAAVAPDLAGAKPESVVRQLTARLTAARRIAAERAQFEEAAAKRAERLRAQDARRQALAPDLSAMRARLGAADDEALALALERCERRRELEIERARCARELAQSGDGRDEAELRAEQQELDPQRLAEAIAALKRRREELTAERRDAARAARDAETEHAALARGRDAAEAARARAEAAGEIVEVAEQWVLRAAARALAARAIERHRQQAQDPLIARAGQMFALATAASFAGLAVGYDSADRPVLVARRPDGKTTVELAGLSEGARDQLFLALRLALLERRAGEPLPFVGDDLLASFDDERAARTLDLLADFGRGRQTILFTHHARVAELAGALGGAAEVIEI